MCVVFCKVVLRWLESCLELVYVLCFGLLYFDDDDDDDDDDDYRQPAAAYTSDSF